MKQPSELNGIWETSSPRIKRQTSRFAWVGVSGILERWFRPGLCSLLWPLGSSSGPSVRGSSSAPVLRHLQSRSRLRRRPRRPSRWPLLRLRILRSPSPSPNRHGSRWRTWSASSNVATRAGRPTHLPRSGRAASAAAPPNRLRCGGNRFPPQPPSRKVASSSRLEVATHTAGVNPAYLVASGI